MSKAIRLFTIAIIGCVLQTNFSQYIRFADIAPDLMIAIIVVLTSFCSLGGGFCTSALMIMFYDASVGYVMALNPVAYILISLAASGMRMFFDAKLVKWKHKSFLIIMVIAFVMTFCREVVYAVYLFLIGSQWTLMTLVRLVLCSAYTAVMTIPCIYLVRALMSWHPFRRRKKNIPDLDEFDAFTHL